MVNYIDDERIVLIDILAYQFHELDENENKKGAVKAKLDMKFTGGHYDDDKKVEVLKGIQFVLNRDCKSYEDFKDVEIIMPDDFEDKIDEPQRHKVFYFANLYYVDAVLMSERDKLPEPTIVF